MKIKAEKLYSFFSKATLNGSINTALVKIEDKKMNIWIRSTDNTTAINATLKNIDAENQVWPISNTTMFLNCLKLFSDIVELKLNENKLSLLNVDRQVDFILADESFIENKLDKYPSVTFDKTTVISTAIFKNTLKNKSVVRSQIAKFISDGKILQVISGSDKFDTITEKISVSLPVATVSLSDCADLIFSNLDDKVELGIKSDYPVLFKFENAEYQIQYVVAPLVENKGD
jgi:hypothetical protein